MDGRKRSHAKVLMRKGVDGDGNTLCPLSPKRDLNHPCPERLCASLMKRGLETVKDDFSGHPCSGKMPPAPNAGVATSTQAPG
jgi:hypothetical protein